MNKREQAKAEIRFYKRFLDELEFAMSVKTTYTNLLKVAQRFGIPLDVLDDFVEDQQITGFDEETQCDFRLSYSMFDSLFYFSLSDEPSYEWADDLRIKIHHQVALERYYQSGQHHEILTELEQEDEQLTRRCKHCGDPIMDKNVLAKYCSQSCKQLAYLVRKRNGSIRHVREEKIEKKQWWFFLIGK